MGVITDPIADMLTRIRNANTANHQTVDIPASRMKLAVGEILKEEGFIRSIERVEEGPQGTLRVTLKYGPEKEKVITGLASCPASAPSAKAAAVKSWRTSGKANFICHA